VRWRPGAPRRPSCSERRPAVDVSFRVHGVDQVDDALADFVDQLAGELAPGFVPESRYRGQQGVPFTLEKIDLVSSRLGFTPSAGELL